MTLATATLATALALTTGQTPPPPPPQPAPVVVPAQPVQPTPPVPPSPVLAPVPPLPGGWERSLLEAQRALEAMPAMETIQAKMFEAEAAMARFNFDRMDFGKFELESALHGWSDQVTINAQSRERENSYYDMGRSALERRNWQDAINRFDQAAQLKGARVDAALYWKAYAQGKNGQRTEALATVNELVKAYPQSRYLNDARALEIELKRGDVSPESQQDEDLKLLAIQGLQHSDPEQAIPLLEKILNSSNGPRIKERALYVLALSNSARAQEILLGIAKGGGNPDLQRKAIDYLATHSRNEGRARLEEVYRTNSDPEIRMRVLRAYVSAGDRTRLLAVAQSEQNEELRMAAIRHLGSAGAIVELGQLYDKESSQAIRLQIVRSLASAGAADRLQQIARAETNPEIRMQAIRSFANMGRERSGTVLQDMYAKETTFEGKRAIIQALHSQNNPEGLVAVARRENDPKLKEQIVRSLSTMTKSKVALDYLMEILNK